jgi:hypothetical protein
MTSITEPSLQFGNQICIRTLQKRQVYITKRDSLIAGRKKGGTLLTPEILSHHHPAGLNVNALLLLLLAHMLILNI